MFKNLRNIASEIKGDHARSTPDDSVSSESKTRRFLSSKSSSSGIHLRKKHKEWEEIDGKTEDETVVHLALVKFFREHGKQQPSYLGHQKSSLQVKSSVSSQMQQQPTRQSLATSHFQAQPSNQHEASRSKSVLSKRSEPSIRRSESRPSLESHTSRFASHRHNNSSPPLRQQQQQRQQQPQAKHFQEEQDIQQKYHQHHAVSAPVARQYHNQEQSSERPQVNHSSSEGSRNETTSPGRFQSRFSSHTSLHNLHTSGSRFGRRKEQ